MKLNILPLVLITTVFVSNAQIRNNSTDNNKEINVKPKKDIKKAFFDTKIKSKNKEGEFKLIMISYEEGCKAVLEIDKDEFISDIIPCKHNNKNLKMKNENGKVIFIDYLPYEAYFIIYVLLDNQETIYTGTM